MDNNIKYLFFDWGDTLMADYPQYSGAMVTWPQITPMKGVVEFLPKLSEKYKCVVVSNAVESDAALMKQAFEKVHLDNYFYLFITSKELGAKKPEPSFFKNALLRIGANTDEVIMIGNDYLRDIESAKAVGLGTILISDKDGIFPNADYVIKDFSQLYFLL